MRTTSTPRLAAERLAEHMGWSVAGRVLRITEDVEEPLEWQADNWLRVLGYECDVLFRKYRFTPEEVWKACEYEPRRTFFKEGGVGFVVQDRGWPSLDVALMLKGHPEVVGGKLSVHVG